MHASAAYVRVGPPLPEPTPESRRLDLWNSFGAFLLSAIFALIIAALQAFGHGAIVVWTVFTILALIALFFAGAMWSAWQEIRSYRAVQRRIDRGLR